MTHLAIVLRLFELVGEDFLQPCVHVSSLVEPEERRLCQNDVLSGQFSPHLGKPFQVSLLFMNLQLVPACITMWGFVLLLHSFNCDQWFSSSRVYSGAFFSAFGL